MKKTVYFLGIISLSIVLLATIFKSSHWPGAGILMTLGLGSITFIFLPLAYSQLLKSTDDKLLRWVYHTALISFGIDFIGMLFKVMHWPGASWFIIIGLPLPFVLFLPTYILYHNKRKLKTDMSFFSIILFMIYLGVFSSLLSLSVSKNIYEAYAVSVATISETNQYIRSKSHVNNETNQLIEQIDRLKKGLMLAVNAENNLALKADGTIHYINVQAKGMQIPIDFFYDAGFDEFNQQFEVYKNKLSAINKDENTVRLINEIDSYRVASTDENSPIITKLSLITALNVLTDWQNKILLIEYLSNRSKTES